FSLPAQALAQLGVVAEFRMHVQRQVIGKQVDVVGQEGAQTLAPESGDTAVLALPEQAVMHEDGVMATGDRAVEQRLARGHAAQHAGHFGPSFHLQTVWAIILEPLSVEQGIEMVPELDELHAASSSNANDRASGLGDAFVTFVLEAPHYAPLVAH